MHFMLLSTSVEIKICNVLLFVIIMYVLKRTNAYYIYVYGIYAKLHTCGCITFVCVYLATIPMLTLNFCDLI